MYGYGTVFFNNDLPNIQMVIDKGTVFSGLILEYDQVSGIIQAKSQNSSVSIRKEHHSCYRVSTPDFSSKIHRYLLVAILNALVELGGKYELRKSNEKRELQLPNWAKLPWEVAEPLV